uniref:FHF complex subunit HOOK-interacting protein 1B n=1 Tax=Hippocampus comes TaxID=109280 RepID=A0A3Q3DS97_HIPCM
MEWSCWLSRLTPRTPAARPGRGATPQEAPSCTADPETCFMVFENHWRQVSVSRVLDQSELSRSTDDLIAVRNHTDQMFCLLAEERPPQGGGGDDGGGEGVGPILQLVVREGVLESLLRWHLRGDPDADSLGALLKLFEMLIGQSQQALLRRPAVLHPLLRVVGACAHSERGCPPALENSLVLLLNQVCVRVAREPALLETLLRAAPAQRGSSDLPLFSLLVPFIHREGAVGQQARDALLLVMATSAADRAVARYIAHNSYFCPVLATGLSALYSSLPRKMEVHGDDWHALRREDWMGVSSLAVFMNSLEFCNAVVQVAHPMVRSQLLDYLHNGFLVSVVAPALYKSSVDEMIASTAYLDLFLRSVSETSLLKTFLRFILLHRLDDDSILDTLLTRIGGNSRLCMVSLSLFRTLLSFNCEDIMLQLVLRYLLPCGHVMLSQRRAIREADMYGKCADKFLSLIPECCRTVAAPLAVREEDASFRGKGECPGSPAPPRPSTPSRLAFFIRQQSGGTPTGAPPGPGGSESPQSAAPDSPAYRPQPEIAAWDSGYLDYLKDARRSIELCSWACRDWSAPYDGEKPSPSAAPLPPGPPTYAPSTAAYPEHSFSWPVWHWASDLLLKCDLKERERKSVVCNERPGPLMAVLLAKLENMPHNSLYVNILLTGIVGRLACYPQPLLCSFLLNTNMVFQPSVKSLIQVLGSVKNRIEAFAASHEDFPAMLRKAQQYLVARGKVDWSEPPGAVPPLRRSDSLVKSRKSSLSELILRHTSSPTRTRSAAQMALAHVRVGGQTLHSALFRGGAGASSLEKQAEALRVKNAVYCAVIFCEFLKELAALAQEHAVALPFARTDAEE